LRPRTILGRPRARDHLDPDPNAAEGAPVEGSAVAPVMCANCGYTMFSPQMMPDQGKYFENSGADLSLGCSWVLD
jgi:hypothetical protein